MPMSDKITAEHLARPAFIYIRQSTRAQVRQHRESRRRQYDLQAHARSLGWQEVVVIDEDLGKSGASTAGRVGFHRLVASVSLGQAGAVFSLDASRLARNNRDWHQLLELCGLMNTLIIDADGVSDPRQPNDRLLLGLKGTMSEAELGWFRQRAHAALMAKARRGELLLNVPVGYVRTPDQRIEKHPDQRVQDAIELVFRKFAELGSVRQLLLWVRQEQIELPAQVPDGPWGQRVTWRLPVYNTLLHFLRNPTYAGAYAFGRTSFRTQIIDGVVHKTRGHCRPRDEWLVLLREHHDGYISWATYDQHQQLIAENAQMKGMMVRGAVRRGPSLLAGLLRCGRCGRRLHVSYSGTRGKVPRYHCKGAHLNHGTAWCISFGGLRVDQAVEREVLAVLGPGAIEAALATHVRVDEETAARRRALELELREAQYEATRSQRQYDAVEPENRLVAETLERRWNQALRRVADLEARLTAVATARRSGGVPDRDRLLQLAKDFPAVWQHPATEPRTKKRLVRLLIEEIVAQTTDATAVDLVIHWKGGKHTTVRVARNRTGQHGKCTDKAIVDVVRDLARRLPDAQIARVLNRLGYRTGAGNTWVQSRVVSLRQTHSITAFEPAAAAEQMLTLAEAAHALGVSATTIRRLITNHILPAEQPLPHVPWAIRREDLSGDAVQRAIAAIQQGRPAPRTPPAAQLPLVKSST
jgi:DNA invertase Pin-like site-specific DNA recombinase